MISLQRTIQRWMKRYHQYNEGKLALRPGCNAEQTLESICSGLLSDIRDSV